jgi:hypothetical protein
MSEYYQISYDPKGSDGIKWERLNFILKRIFEAIEKIDSMNGPVVQHNNMDMGGHKILNGPANQQTAASTEFVTKEYIKSKEAAEAIRDNLMKGGKAPLPTPTP